jgi:beta-glucosidase
MCSYSWIGGLPACEDAYTLTDVLRKQWNYTGFVTSDWFATHSTIDSANNGLDMEMPYNQFFGAPLQQAVADGAVSIDTVDSMLKPILTQMFRFHLFTRVQTGSPSSVVTSPQHATVAREVAEQGAVLLKNSAGLLPLSVSRPSLAVIGEDAGPNDGSGLGIKWSRRHRARSKRRTGVE